MKQNGRCHFLGLMAGAQLCFSFLVWSITQSTFPRLPFCPHMYNQFLECHVNCPIYLFMCSYKEVGKRYDIDGSNTIASDVNRTRRTNHRWKNGSVVTTAGGMALCQLCGTSSFPPQFPLLSDARRVVPIIIEHLVCSVDPTMGVLQGLTDRKEHV